MKQSSVSPLIIPLPVFSTNEDSLNPYQTSIYDTKMYLNTWTRTKQDNCQ